MCERASSIALLEEHIYTIAALYSGDGKRVGEHICIVEGKECQWPCAGGFPVVNGRIGDEIA